MILALKRSSFAGIFTAVSEGKFLKNEKLDVVIQRCNEVLDKRQIYDQRLRGTLIRFISNTQISADAAEEILVLAIENADTFLQEIALARELNLPLKGELSENQIETMADVFLYAKQKFNLSPPAVHVVMKLKNTNSIGIRALIRKGEVTSPWSISIQKPIGDTDLTIEDTMGAEDTGIARFESKRELESLLDENLLSAEGRNLVLKILEGHDLDDDEYSRLGAEIRQHPALIEILYGNDLNGK